MSFPPRAPILHMCHMCHMCHANKRHILHMRPCLPTRLQTDRASCTCRTCRTCVTCVIYLHDTHCTCCQQAATKRRQPSDGNQAIAGRRVASWFEAPRVGPAQVGASNGRGHKNFNISLTTVRLSFTKILIKVIWQSLTIFTRPAKTAIENV